MEDDVRNVVNIGTHSEAEGQRLVEKVEGNSVSRSIKGHKAILQEFTNDVSEKAQSSIYATACDDEKQIEAEGQGLVEKVKGCSVSRSIKGHKAILQVFTNDVSEETQSSIYATTCDDKKRIEAEGQGLVEKVEGNSAYRSIEGHKAILQESTNGVPEKTHSLIYDTEKDPKNVKEVVVKSGNPVKLSSKETYDAMDKAGIVNATLANHNVAEAKLIFKAPLVITTRHSMELIADKGEIWMRNVTYMYSYTDGLKSIDELDKKFTGKEVLTYHTFHGEQEVETSVSELKLNVGDNILKIERFSTSHFHNRIIRTRKSTDDRDFKYIFSGRISRSDAEIFEDFCRSEDDIIGTISVNVEYASNLSPNNSNEFYEKIQLMFSDDGQPLASSELKPLRTSEEGDAVQVIGGAIQFHCIESISTSAGLIEIRRWIDFGCLESEMDTTLKTQSAPQYQKYFDRYYITKPPGSTSHKQQVEMKEQLASVLDDGVLQTKLLSDKNGLENEFKKSVEVKEVHKSRVSVKEILQKIVIPEIRKLNKWDFTRIRDTTKTSPTTTINQCHENLVLRENFSSAEVLQSVNDRSEPAIPLKLEKVLSDRISKSHSKERIRSPKFISGRYTHAAVKENLFNEISVTPVRKPCPYYLRPREISVERNVPCSGISETRLKGSSGKSKSRSRSRNRKSIGNTGEAKSGKKCNERTTHKDEQRVEEHQLQLSVEGTACGTQWKADCIVNVMSMRRLSDFKFTKVTMNEETIWERN